MKEFQDEFFVRHALILDTFAGSENATAFEEAVSVAASFACTVGTQESLLDLLFVGPQAVCFTTGRGLGQAEQALEILASVRLCQEKPFDALPELVMRHAGDVCGCVCVLLDWDEPRRELVRQLRARGLPVLVLVVVGAGEVDKFRDAHEEDAPGNFHLLEAGKLADGLPTHHCQRRPIHRYQRQPTRHCRRRPIHRYQQQPTRHCHQTRTAMISMTAMWKTMMATITTSTMAK